MAMTVGRVVEHPGNSRLDIGLYIPRGGPRGVPAPVNIEALRSLLMAGGAEINVVDDIQAAKFHKNLWNTIFVTFGYLTRVPIAFYINTPSLWDRVMPLLLETGKEVVAVGRSLGFSEEGFSSSSLEDLIAITREGSKNWPIDYGHKVSTHLDVEGGRPFEVEVIVGEVVRLGKELGVAMPR
ncbi:hypothetical protein FRB94_000060 [Tulasnella sp. JGI-2019a]|nr:hypothetical protein FRB94_000060 [Tulasnella sp. JGI-2019a]